MKNDNIDVIREKLTALIFEQQKQLTTAEVVMLSQQLDKLILLQMKEINKIA